MENSLNSFLGKGSEFEGKLIFDGEVIIAGKFSGEIATSDKLIVEEGAEVNATVSAGVVIIKGRVTGNINAEESLEIVGKGELYGDIKTPNLVIERGAIYEGHCTMKGIKEKSGSDSPFKPSPSDKDDSAEKNLF